MNTILSQLKELAANKVLLLVEDDPLILDSLSRLLSHFFITVIQTSNVEEAIETFQQHYHENTAQLLIITDINLGMESGNDLTCYLKKIDSKQRVIAISGTEERSVFIESIRCGIDRFILKPIDHEELFEALISVMQKMEYDQELQNNRKLLEESREYALRLLKEQDQFLKNAIHEIHTPLSVIITNIDLLRLSAIDNESLDAIEAGSRIIQNSYEDMTYLMKHDRIPAPTSKIDIVSFISERKRYFTCIAQVHELSISMRVGQPNIPLIDFSELKLARLVDNTLSNAIKYSHRRSEINIIIGMRNKDLFFEIRNHGPIIQDKKKIFQRFHRESDFKGGYGLGLSIVSQICDEEKIDIEISSTPVRGTSFRYILKNATFMQHNSPTMALSLHMGVQE